MPRLCFVSITASDKKRHIFDVHLQKQTTGGQLKLSMAQHTQTNTEREIHPDVINATDTAYQFWGKKYIHTEGWCGFCPHVPLEGTVTAEQCRRS